MGASTEQGTRAGEQPPALEQLVDTALGVYAEALREAGSPLVLRPELWHSCERQGREILTECLGALYGADEDVSRDAEFVSMALGVRRSHDEVSPVDSVHAARVLFDAAVTTMQEATAVLPAELALPRLMIAVRTLHRAISTRVGAAAIGYDSATLRGVGEVSNQRRHQLARDLHDHVGSSIGLALRCLDLYAMEQETGVHGSRDRLADARQALRDVFRLTRSLVSGLRANELHDNLKQEIDSYSAAASTGPVDVRTRIHGDETWLPERFRQEVFLVVREALRNAFAHAAAEHIDISVSVFPDAVHGVVADDGVGLPDALASADGAGHRARSASDGSGLIAMRQRVTGLGGTLELAGARGQGTEVRFRIPLAAEDAPAGAAGSAAERTV
ncbi:sensor histidine kinase [Streptomyces cremeus]|uniref:Sensor histidine kinase n=1 Tax=Streptomyces cremeus TaxID=66881 RepID=A0ABV5PLP2_STRCM